MGVTDSKYISNLIDKDFKSIRKYYDHFYGQITLVQKKSNQKLFALVQKIILNSDHSLAQFLSVRKQFTPYLVQLHQHYSCSLDYCSGSQKYFFLLQYSQHTLYNQIIQRQQNNIPFTYQQLSTLFINYLELTSYLKDKNQIFKSFVSNHFVLYQSSQSLKTLQSFFKVENDSFQFDFHLIKNNQNAKFVYLAPQAFKLMCNKERFQAKNISYTEKAIVFMIGMNFLQCSLLTEVQRIYNFNRKTLNFSKINLLLQQVSKIYGKQIYQIISQMLNQNPNNRPNIQDIKEFMKLNLKRRKIVIPKHTKQEHPKTKIVKV